MIVQAWLASYVLTLTIEIPLAAALMGRDHPWKPALAAGLGTTMTHPLLWFLWPHVVSDYWLYIVSGEVGVVLLETVVYRALVRIDWGRAFGVAALVNAASYLLGTLF